MSADVLRPVEEGDLDALIALARAGGAGVSTLQADRRHLAERIGRSVDAFGRPASRPGAEEYLFALHRPGVGLVGTSAIVARVGGFDPFYTYEVRAEPVTHPPLGIARHVDVLHLRREHKGPSELCGLVVAPAARGTGAGRLASLGRLLYLAAHRERFAERVLVEIRGHVDEDGRSPFWEGVGRTFFAPRGFAEADALTGLGEKDFVADLMPRHPIYVDLLPDAVRRSIGRAHAYAVPAERMLLEEGFRPSREVDIFDAGPILECETALIRTVREARWASVGAVRDAPGGLDALVAAPAPASFRVARGPVVVGEDGLTLGRGPADRLGAEPGTRVLIAPAAGRG